MRNVNCYQNKLKQPTHTVSLYTFRISFHKGLTGAAKTTLAILSNESNTKKYQKSKKEIL